jgi:hypothetical protein
MQQYLYEGEAYYSYPVYLDITDEGGNVEYPSLHGGGSLIRLSLPFQTTETDAGAFQENITRGGVEDGGRIVNHGIVTVQLYGQRLFYSYSPKNLFDGGCVAILDPVVEE